MKDEFDVKISQAVMKAAQKAKEIVIKTIEEWDVELDYDISITIRSPTRTWSHRLISNYGRSNEEYKWEVGE